MQHADVRFVRVMQLGITWMYLKVEGVSYCRAENGRDCHEKELHREKECGEILEIVCLNSQFKLVRPSFKSSCILN